MKKFFCAIVLTGVMLIALTGCKGNEKNSNIANSNASTSSNDTTPSNNATQNSINNSEQKKENLKSFSQMVQFYLEDPKYDANTMCFEIYLEKVQVKDKEEEQVIVASNVLKSEENTLKQTTVAAVYDYKDVYRTDGPYIQAKEVWYNEGTAYTAESIIDAALKEAGKTEEELNLNEKIVLYTTFQN